MVGGAGAPAFCPTAVATNLIGEPASPDALAVTTYSPGSEPRVKVVEARPLLLVIRGWLFDRLAFPVAILNVTATPGTEFPLASLTCTTNGNESSMNWDEELASLLANPLYNSAASFASGVSG